MGRVSFAGCEDKKVLADERKPVVVTRDLALASGETVRRQHRD